ncbi:MAG: helix-turn-helix transcriptional regulator [Sneathiella sp.]
MDIRTLCLGILTMGDATGYEIKKTFEERLDLIFHASYGSIYPALNKLTEEGLVSCRAFAQQKRPDKKIYSITSSGRCTFLDEILKKPAADRFRSEFLATLMFAHLLPAATIAELIDERILESQRKIDSMNSNCNELPTDREQFLCGYGRAVYQAEIDYLQENRHLLEADALMGSHAAE